MTTIYEFLPAINSLPYNKKLSKQNLLTKQFLLEQEEQEHNLNMFYSPHNEYINRDAKIVIIGITPGWKQMKTAFTQFLNGYHSGLSIQTCLKKSKEAASFSGSMRNNLLEMMEQCDIPKVLDILSASDLFGGYRSLLHTTSIIKYPVFYKDKNYTGYHPPIDHSSLLKQYAYEKFPYEISQIQPPAIVIPLGKTVERVIKKLNKEQKIPKHYYLTGFPHPSGANGHRLKQFQQNKQKLQEQINEWLNS